MRVIYKYPVSTSFSLLLPKGATVLAVQMQNDEPQMWVLQEKIEATQQRHFECFGTGHPIPDTAGDYCGTFSPEAGLIFHLFESKEDNQ